jgi:hypothetical protein
MQKGVVVAEFGIILSLDWKGMRKLLKPVIMVGFLDII